MVADIRRKINMIDHVKEKEEELLNLPKVVTEEKYVAKDDFEVLSFNNWGAVEALLIGTWKSVGESGFGGWKQVHPFNSRRVPMLKFRFKRPWFEPSYQ